MSRGIRNVGVPLMLLLCPVMFTKVLGFPARDLLSWRFAEYLLIFIAAGVVAGALYGCSCGRFSRGSGDEWTKSTFVAVAAIGVVTPLRAFDQDSYPDYFGGAGSQS